MGEVLHGARPGRRNRGGVRRCGMTERPDGDPAPIITTEPRRPGETLLAWWQRVAPGQPFPWPLPLPDTPDVFVDGLSALDHLMPRGPFENAHWQAAGKQLLQEHMRGNLTLYGRRHYLAPLAGGGWEERVEAMAAIPRDAFPGDAEVEISAIDWRLSLHARYGRGQRPQIDDYYTDIRVETAGLLKAFPLADAPTADAPVDAPTADAPQDAVDPESNSPRGALKARAPDIAVDFLNSSETPPRRAGGRVNVRAVARSITARLEAEGFRPHGVARKSPQAIEAARHFMAPGSWERGR
jgi:hypothetical protein